MSSPFSEYDERRRVPSPAVGPGGWDWQRPAGTDRTSGPGLTDEDKLCFFERGPDTDLKVPGRVGGVSGSVSLGSAGDSPDSPLSSSPSPSPASPGGLLGRVAPPPVPGSPARRAETSLPSESSPKVAMPQVAPPGVSSEDDSEEEDEDEDDEDLEPCFMTRAQQQRKAMRRALSECSHLSVPTSLELPDQYPPAPRRPPHSVQRSLTVADDQPTPTMSAAGITLVDLRQAPPPPGPRLSFGISPDSQTEEFRERKETGGVVLPVPTGPKRSDAEGTLLGSHGVKESDGLKTDSFPDTGEDFLFRNVSKDFDTYSNPFFSAAGRYNFQDMLEMSTGTIYSSLGVIQGRPTSVFILVSNWTCFSLVFELGLDF